MSINISTGVEAYDVFISLAILLMMGMCSHYFVEWLFSKKYLTMGGTEDGKKK